MRGRPAQQTSFLPGFCPCLHFILRTGSLPWTAPATPSFKLCRTNHPGGSLSEWGQLLLMSRWSVSQQSWRLRDILCRRSLARRCHCQSQGWRSWRAGRRWSQSCWGLAHQWAGDCEPHWRDQMKNSDKLRCATRPQQTFPPLTHSFPQVSHYNQFNA